MGPFRLPSSRYPYFSTVQSLLSISTAIIELILILDIEPRRYIPKPSKPYPNQIPPSRSRSTKPHIHPINNDDNHTISPHNPHYHIQFATYLIVDMVNNNNHNFISNNNHHHRHHQPPPPNNTTIIIIIIIPTSPHLVHNLHNHHNPLTSRASHPIHSLLSSTISFISIPHNDSLYRNFKIVLAFLTRPSQPLYIILSHPLYYHQLIYTYNTH